MGKTEKGAEDLSHSVQNHKSKKLWKKTICLGNSHLGLSAHPHPAPDAHTLGRGRLGGTLASPRHRSQPRTLGFVCRMYRLVLETGLFSSVTSLQAPQATRPEPGVGKTAAQGPWAGLHPGAPAPRGSSGGGAVTPTPTLSLHIGQPACGFSPFSCVCTSNLELR